MGNCWNGDWTMNITRRAASTLNTVSFVCLLIQKLLFLLDLSVFCLVSFLKVQKDSSISRWSGHFNGVKQVSVSMGSFLSDPQPMWRRRFGTTRKSLLSSSNFGCSSPPITQGQPPTTEKYFYANRSFCFHSTMSANGNKKEQHFVIKTTKQTSHPSLDWSRAAIPTCIREKIVRVYKV